MPKHSAIPTTAGGPASPGSRSVIASNCIAAGLIVARHQPRGSRRAGLGHPLRVGGRRLRHPVGGCGHHHRVSDHQRRGRRVHRRQLGQPHRRRGEPDPGGQAGGAPRRAARRREGGDHRRRGRRRLGDNARGARAARQAAARRLAQRGHRARRRHPARAAGHPDLHLGHHREAEGGAADPRGVDLHRRRHGLTAASSATRT